MKVWSGQVAVETRGTFVYMIRAFGRACWSWVLIIHFRPIASLVLACVFVLFRRVRFRALPAYTKIWKAQIPLAPAILSTSHICQWRRFRTGNVKVWAWAVFRLMLQCWLFKFTRGRVSWLSEICAFTQTTESSQYCLDGEVRGLGLCW